MCVIIDRKAGAVIPFDKLEVACDINKHGFGLVFAEKGQLHIIRDLNNNDPKLIQKLLEEHKDRRLWLHLRHATVGEVILENSHPMISTTKAEDGEDIVFMHNGTLHEFTSKDANDKKSDTYYFNERFVKPMVKRCLPYGGLQDKFFHWQVGKALNYSHSVLVFIDGTGYTLRGNGDKGKEFEWGWASNDYSFDTQHLRSSTRTWSNYDAADYGFPTTGSVQKWNGRTTTKKKVKDAHFTEAWKVLDVNDDADQAELNGVVQDAILRMDLKAVNNKLKEVWKVTEKSLENDIKSAASLNPVVRESFVKQAGLSSIDEVNRLSREDFIDLCDNHPNAMAELFIDLCAENRKLKAFQLARSFEEKKNGTNS